MNDGGDSSWSGGPLRKTTTEETTKKRIFILSAVAEMGPFHRQFATDKKKGSERDGQAERVRQGDRQASTVYFLVGW